MRDPTPYNPLDKVNLGASVAEALLEQDDHPLGSLSPAFTGAGVYAIYYEGAFGAYDRLAEHNKDGKLEAPIYVGKADAAGARKGGLGLDAAPGKALHRRISKHAKSIDFVDSLDIKDFKVRFLVVEPIFVSLGESLLIATFSPIWNQLVDGFGNHDPGAGRYSGMRPRWDVLHPGRPWADKCKPRDESAEQIAAEVRAHLRAITFPRSVMVSRSPE